MVVSRLSANLQQRCYRNIGLAVQMMWQFEAVGRRPQERQDGPAWNAFKNVRNPSGSSSCVMRFVFPAYETRSSDGAGVCSVGLSVPFCKLLHAFCRREKCRHGTVGSSTAAHGVHCSFARVIGIV